MKITDKTISKGTKIELIKTIIKEEVLPLIDDPKVRQYAESNLRGVSVWVRDEAELEKEKITIDWLCGAVHCYVMDKKLGIKVTTEIEPITTESIIKVIEYTVSQVITNSDTKEIKEIQIATFMSLKDAKEYVDRKGIETINKITGRDMFFKIDAKVVKKISN